MVGTALPYVLEEEVEAAAKIHSQWPKRCSVCGAGYADMSEWRRLPLISKSDGRKEIEGDIFEFRDCPCGNTLTLIIRLGDI